MNWRPAPTSMSVFPISTTSKFGQRRAPRSAAGWRGGGQSDGDWRGRGGSTRRQAMKPRTTPHCVHAGPDSACATGAQGRRWRRDLPEPGGSETKRSAADGATTPVGSQRYVRRWSGRSTHHGATCRGLCHRCRCLPHRAISPEGCTPIRSPQ